MEDVKVMQHWYESLACIRFHRNNAVTTRVHIPQGKQGKCDGFMFKVGNIVILLQKYSGKT